MSNSPYKTNPSPEAGNCLLKRSSLYKQADRLNWAHLKDIGRNPAYSIITSENGGRVSVDTEKFEDTYGGFKLKPMLTNTTIRYGGNFGLTVELHASIQCHTKNQFEEIEKQFLYPGTIVNVEFGYKVPWDAGGYQEQILIKGFRVATFSFNASSEGIWVCEFKAIAPATSLMSTDIGYDVSISNLKYKAGGKQYSVIGIPELITYYAQGNGSFALEQIPDGYSNAIQNTGAVVVYKNEHLETPEDSNTSTSSKQQSQVTGMARSIYVTLDFIVEHLLNNVLLLQYKKNQPHGTDSTNRSPKTISKNFAIKFDDKLSYSYTSPHLISAYPTRILIMGSGNGGWSGNYTAESGGKDIGKHFWEILEKKNRADCKMNAINNRLKVDFKKILIERHVVMEALNFDYEAKRVSETNKPKEHDESFLTIENFLERIFNEIATASGQQIKLRLAIHPDVLRNPNDPKKDYLYIFDENNGFMGDQIFVITFDPVDGDGTTRSCNLQSEAGSKEYQGYMMSSQKKENLPNAEVHNQTKNGNMVENPTKLTMDTLKSIMELVHKSLPDSKFDEIHMQSLELCMNQLRKGTENNKKMDMLVYPGLTISVELDGVHGIFPGNAISSTQLPNSYFKANTYFFVDSVEHVIANNDWETKLTGILSFNDTVNYKKYQL